MTQQHTPSKDMIDIIEGRIQLALFFRGMSMGALSIHVKVYKATLSACASNLRIKRMYITRMSYALGVPEGFFTSKEITIKVKNSKLISVRIPHQ